MNAMLEPRIVAARIHGSAALAHGAAAGLDRTKPSSHGCVKMFAIQPRLLRFIRFRERLRVNRILRLLRKSLTGVEQFVALCQSRCRRLPHGGSGRDWYTTTKLGLCAMLSRT